MTRVPPAKRSYDRAAAVIARDERVLAENMKLRQYPLVAARAQGATVWDVDGNEYVDWFAASAVANVGYQHPAVVAAVRTALEAEYCSILACHSSVAAVELAERLVAEMPGEFEKRVWFGLSGSDAMDFLARQLSAARGRPILLSFMGGFAGLTTGAASLSGHPAHAGSPSSASVVKLPYPNPYRCSWGPCSSEGCSLRCLRFVEDEVIPQLAPRSEAAAVVIEAIQADNGDLVPPDNYLPALRELCDRQDLWLVIDEVKTGFGRTGAMFAFQHSGVVPDAVAVGKPLAAGLPLSAVIGRRELFEGGRFTAFTLAGSPVPARAACAALDAIESDGLIAQARLLGERLQSGLQEMQRGHPLIGDVRGRGMLIGVELVLDRATRLPASRAAGELVYRCFELGLLLSHCGSLSNVIEITPPLMLSEEECDAGLEIFERALTDVEQGRVDPAKLAKYGASLAQGQRGVGHQASPLAAPTTGA